MSQQFDMALTRRAFIASAFGLLGMAAFCSAYDAFAAPSTMALTFGRTISGLNLFRVSNSVATYSGLNAFCVEPYVNSTPEDFVAQCGTEAIVYPNLSGTGIPFNAHSASYSAAQIHRFAVAHEYLVNQGTLASVLSSHGKNSNWASVAAYFDFWLKRFCNPSYAGADNSFFSTAHWNEFVQKEAAFYANHKNDYVAHALPLYKSSDEQVRAIFWVTKPSGFVRVEKSLDA